MRIVPMEKLREGMALARSVFDLNGVLVVPSSRPLDRDLLDRLLRTGQSRVFVLDSTGESSLPWQRILEAVHFVVNRRYSLDETGDSPAFEPHSDLFTETALSERLHASSAVAGTRMAPDILEIISASLQEALNYSEPLLSYFLHYGMSRGEVEHALDVAVVSLLIAWVFEYPEQEMRQLAISALVHDLGKQTLPFDFLRPDDQLGPDEKALLQEHAIYSSLLLQGSDPSSVQLQQAVQQHHERFDGKGHPLGYLGSSEPPMHLRKPVRKHIHRYGEILSVANSYVNLVSGRISGTPVEQQLALQELIEGIEVSYQPNTVQALCRLVQRFPVGSMVTVRSNSSGRHVGFSGILREVIEDDDGSTRPGSISLTHNSSGKKIAHIHYDASTERHLHLDLVL